MESNYYIRLNARIHGPFTAQQLVQLATSGKLKPNMEVRCGDAGQWVLAGSLKGLFPRPAAAEVEPPIAKPIAASTHRRTGTGATDGGDFDWGTIDHLQPFPNAPPANANYYQTQQPSAQTSRRRTLVDDYLASAQDAYAEDFSQVFRHSLSNTPIRTWVVDFLLAMGVVILIHLVIYFGWRNLFWTFFVPIPMAGVAYKAYSDGNASRCITTIVAGILGMFIPVIWLIVFFAVYAK